MTLEERQAVIDKFKALSKERKRLKQIVANRKWRSANPEKAREAYRKWKAANLEQARENGRTQALKGYGLTVVEWEAKFNEQGRCCGICKSATTKGKNWHTDHCAKTGLVRSILCFDCNRTVANHSAEHLRKCADYVEKWLKLHSN